MTGYYSASSFVAASSAPLPALPSRRKLPWRRRGGVQRADEAAGPSVAGQRFVSGRMSVNGSVRTENSSLDKRVHDLVTKEAARADKLQRRLDEERAVSAALRQQLKSSTGTQQHLAQQLRALQGAPGVPVATRDGNRSVPQLERQISKLQDQLDLEKKATNAERLGRQRLAAQLSDQTAAQARFEASRDELQRTVARKGAELRRAHDLLREGGQAQDSTLAELSTVKERHERHRTRPLR